MKLGFGADTKFLELEMIQGMHIPLPSLEEQDAVLNDFKALKNGTDAVSESLSDKLAQIHALKSVIHSQEVQPPRSEAA